MSQRTDIGFVNEMIEDVASYFVDAYRPDRKIPIDSWPWEELQNGFKTTFNADTVITALDCSQKHDGNMEEYFTAVAKTLLEEKFSGYDEEQIKLALREILLSIFDQHWKDHLQAMDSVKEGINLRAYAQKDPLNEYKREAFALFENMLLNIKRNISKVLSNIQFEQESEEIQEDVYKDQKLEKDSDEERGSFITGLDVKAKLAAQQFPEEVKKKEAKDKNCLLNFYPKNKIPRNTRCQSTGLKFKNCCGKVS